MQPIQLRDRDGNVIYEGGKDTVRNLAAMNQTMKTMKTTSVPSSRMMVQADKDNKIIKRNKSPMLAGLHDSKKPMKLSNHKSVNKKKAYMTFNKSNKLFAEGTKHDRSASLYNERLLLPTYNS